MSVSDFLKRTADRNGFSRDRFEERRIPTDNDSLSVVAFFGDYRSSFVLSSWLFHRFKETHKPSKYLILASWPGLAGLFPQADEYWSLQDASQMKRFFEQADGFRNRSDLATIYNRNLNEYFREVNDWRKVVEPYYSNGITQQFWDDYKHVKCFLPHVPSAAILGKDFNRELATRAGYKVFISPQTFVQSWRQGRIASLRTGKEFWCELVKRLVRDGFVPVVWQNFATHDLSADFTTECLYITETDITKVLSAMRATGCVLDVFGGLSRLAIAARCPYLALDERSRYSALKEQEVDDLCARKLPKEYIYTFSTIISDGASYAWNSDLFNSIVGRLNTFLPELDRDGWPSTGESLEIVPYALVRKNRNKTLGVRLLKVTRD